MMGRLHGQRVTSSLLGWIRNSPEYWAVKAWPHASWTLHEECLRAVFCARGFLLAFHFRLQRPTFISRIDMSSTANTTSTSSNFKALFDAALDKYTKRTGQDLRNHPMAAIIDRCGSLDSVLAVFQEQSLAFDRFRSGDPELLKWLTPVVNRLHAISTNAALSAGTSLVSTT